MPRAQFSANAGGAAAREPGHRRLGLTHQDQSSPRQTEKPTGTDIYASDRIANLKYILSRVSLCVFVSLIVAGFFEHLGCLATL